jgi:CHAT domain-containing protein
MVLGVSDFSGYRKQLAVDDSLWAPRWREALSAVPDLPMVRDEVRSLQALAPDDSTGLIDRGADEAALRKMTTVPAVLHLASHGFNVPLSDDRDLSSDPSALYENGILLAISGGDDGILFPEEAAALDLRDTLLVTLSTCRGALGRPVSGEGLLGLRRGFTKAGARHVLGSLWEIPDKSTAEFMGNYYASLTKDPQPAQLLWRMQRESLAAVRDEDPKSGPTEEAILSYGGFVMTSP